MSYQTYKWAFKSKMLGVKFVIYAREEETAKKIIAIHNTFSNYNFKPARFHYKEAVSIKYPPFAIEMDEMEEAKRQLNNRREYAKKYPETSGSWLANDDGTL